MSVEFDFGKIEQAIDRAVASLEKLDKTLATSAKSASTFNKLFGTSAQFDRFIKSVKELDKTSAENFKILADSVLALVKAVNKIPADHPGLANLIKNFKELNELSRATSATKGTSRVGTYLVSLVSSIEDVYKRLRRIETASPESLKAIASVRRIFKSIQEINNSIPSSGMGIASFIQGFVDQIVRLSALGTTANFVDFKSVAKLSAALVQAVRGMLQGFIALPDPSKINQQINSLFSIFQKLNDFVVLIGGDKIKSLTSVLNSFGNTLSSINRFMALIAGEKMNVDVRVFDTMSLLFEKVRRLFADIINLGNVKNPRGLQAATAMIKAFGRLMKDLTTLGAPSEGLVKWAVNVGEYIKILAKMKTLFRAFADAAEGIRGGRNLSQLGNGIRDLVNAMTNINKMVDAKEAGIGDEQTVRTKLQRLADFALFLPRVITSLISGLDIAARVKRKIGIGALPAVIREIGFISTAIGKIAGSIPDNIAVQKVGDAIKNISAAMQTFNDLASSKGKNFDLGPRILRRLGIGQLPNLMTEIGFVATRLGKTAGGLKDLDKLRDLGIALDNFSKFFNSINKMSLADFKAEKKFLIFTRVGSKFDQVANVLKKFADAFQGFKGVNVPNLGEILPAISVFATQIKDIDFSKNKLNGFEAFTNQLGKGLSNLSRARVDASKLASIGSALSGISGRFGGAGGGRPQSIFRDAAGDFLGQLGAQAISTALSRFEGFVRRLLTFDSRIRNSLNSIGNSIRNFGRSADFIGRSLIRNFGIEGLLSGEALASTAEFDHLLNQIQTFGNLTDEQTLAAEKFADTIAQKYPQSAAQASAAILDLLKAGQSLEEIEFTLPSAADLSALGDVPIERASSAIITAINVFDDLNDTVQATFQNSNIAANYFSAAADVSVASLEEIVQGFENVGPAAQAAGLDVSQTLATLATLANRGLRGAEGGTGLRSALNALFNRPQARDQLAFLEERVLQQTGQQIDLALSDANGQLREFDDILDSINAAYDALNLTEAERLASLGQLADTYGRNTLAILLNAGGYDEMLDRMEQVESAEARAQKLMDDFQGSSKKLTAAIKTLTKNAFSPLLDTLKPFVDVARDGVGALINLPTALFEFASSAILVSSVLATLAGSFLIATGAVAKFQGAITIMASTFISIFTRIPFTIALITGFAGTIAILATAFVALGVAVAGISLVFNEFRRVVRNNIGGAGSAFNRFRREATRAFEALAPAFEQFRDVLESLFGGIFQSESRVFGDRVAGFFDRLTQGAITARRSIQQFGAFFEVFSNFVNAQEGGETAAEIAEINSQLTRLSRLSIIKGIFGDDINAAGLRNIFNTMQRGFKDIGRGIQQLLSGGIGILFGEPGSVQKVKSGAGLLLKTFAKAISRITGIDLTESIFNFEGGNIREGLANFFKAVLDEVKNLITENRGAFVEIITQLVTLATPVKLFNIAGFILRVFGLDQAANVVEDIGRRIQDVIRSAINFAIDLMTGKVEFFSELAQFIRDGDIHGAIDLIADKLKDVIKGVLGSIPRLLREIGDTLSIPFLSELGITLEESEAFERIVNAIGQLVAQPVSKLIRILDGIQGFIEAVAVGNPGAVATLAAGIGLLATKLNLLGKLRSFFVFSVIINGLSNLRTLLEGDIVDFIESTLLDISSDIFNLLTGQNIDADGLRIKLEEGLNAIGETLPPLIQALGQRIADEIIRLGTVLVNSLNDARARLDQAAGALSTGFGDAYFAALEAIRGGDPISVFSALSDQRIDDTAAYNLAVGHTTAILDAFSRAISQGGFDAVSDDLFGQIVGVLGNADLLDEAMDRLPSEDLKRRFAEKIAAILNPANEIRLGADVTDQIAGSIYDEIMSTERGLLLSEANSDDWKLFIKSVFDGAGFSNLNDQQIASVLDEILGSDFGKAIFGGVNRRLVESLSEEFRNSPTEVPVDIQPEAVSVDTSSVEDSIVDAVESLQPEAVVEVSVRTFITPSSISNIRNLFTRRPGDVFRTGSPRSSEETIARIKGIQGPFQSRGKGGTLDKYSTYGVHDTTRPEIAMFADGTSLLFTGAAKGRMVKIMGMASAPAMNPGEDFISDYKEWRKENRGSSVSQEEDNLEEISDLLGDIGEAFIDFVNDEKEAREKHHQEVLDDERQYNHDRENIVNEGRESLLDAIRRGDGAAALQAVKNAKKQLKELEFNAETQQIQRDRNLQETLKNLREEYHEKVASYEEQIAELRESNDEILEEDQEFYEEELTMLQQHHDDAQQEMEEAGEEYNRSQLSIAEEGDNKVLGVIRNIFNNLTSISPSLQAAINRIFDAFILKINEAGAAIGNMPSPPPYTPAPPIGPPNIYPQPTPPGGPPVVGPPIGGVGSPPPFPGSYFGQTMVWGGKTWIWVGIRWQEAFIHGMAKGGALRPNNAYQIFDTNKPELMNIGGRTVLLSGNQRGNISPINPRHNGYGGGRGGDMHVSVNIGDINSNAADPSLVADEVLSTVIPQIERIVTKANRGNRRNSGVLDIS